MHLRPVNSISTCSLCTLFGVGTSYDPPVTKSGKVKSLEVKSDITNEAVAVITARSIDYSAW